MTGRIEGDKVMIFGMSIAAFVTLHVILSLIGIVAGLLLVFGLIQGKNSEVWAAAFLAITILTSVTGFPIPPFGLDPPRIVGILSLALLAAAVAALYVFHLAGHWRWIYVVASTAALYLNCFVAVVQAFQKVPFVTALAPTQSEPPFAIAQLTVLAILIASGVLAVRNFHPMMRRSAFSPR
jgi:hypothetical protein